MTIYVFSNIWYDRQKLVGQRIIQSFLFFNGLSKLHYFLPYIIHNDMNFFLIFLSYYEKKWKLHRCPLWQFLNFSLSRYIIQHYGWEQNKFDVFGDKFSNFKTFNTKLNITRLTWHIILPKARYCVSHLINFRLRQYFSSS